MSAPPVTCEVSVYLKSARTGAIEPIAKRITSAKRMVFIGPPARHRRLSIQGGCPDFTPKPVWDWSAVFVAAQFESGRASGTGIAKMPVLLPPGQVDQVS